MFLFGYEWLGSRTEACLQVSRLAMETERLGLEVAWFWHNGRSLDESVFRRSVVEDVLKKFQSFRVREFVAL